MTSASDIGKFINRLRLRRGLSQADFAKALKTSQSAVARMEKGQQNFTTEILGKISKALNSKIVSLASSEQLNFKIQGGEKLSGKVVTNSSKNCALGLMCASLLNQGTTTLKNMPQIEEVFRICEVLQSIGVRLVWQGKDLHITPPKKFDIQNLDYEAAVKTRSVIMLMGPLAHFISRFSLPFAGGCKLGERTVAPHLFALKAFGISIKTVHDHYDITASRLKSADLTLYEMGDTVTENVLMAAALAPGKTVVRLASANYMVQEVCYFLKALGVKVSGIGSSVLEVTGVKSICKDFEYTVSEDPIESMLFLSLAATTNSSFVIERCPLEFLRLELLKLEKMGFQYKILKTYLSPNGHALLGDIKTSENNTPVSLAEKIHPLPSNTGINIDNLPFFVPIATRCKGRTLVHDWVYENRAIYYLELNKLRANITLLDAHRVIVEGPTELRSAEVICPPALRPAAIILIAMLAAKGSSMLRNVYSINRGYEDLVSRLQKLGAKIEIV